jgi:hypothetical protein
MGSLIEMDDYSDDCEHCSAEPSFHSDEGLRRSKRSRNPSNTYVEDHDGDSPMSDSDEDFSHPDSPVVDNSSMGDAGSLLELNTFI